MRIHPQRTLLASRVRSNRILPNFYCTVVLQYSVLHVFAPYFVFRLSVSLDVDRPLCHISQEPATCIWILAVVVNALVLFPACIQIMEYSKGWEESLHLTRMSKSHTQSHSTYLPWCFG
jgi:hypothetical protein